MDKFRIKLILALFTLIIACCTLVYSQAATHSATLTWDDAQVGGTYTLSRATGLCSGNPTFSKLATGLTVKTYTDSTITIGNYCYEVTVTISGLESSPSNLAPGTLLPVPVTNLQIKVQ